MPAVDNAIPAAITTTVVRAKSRWIIVHLLIDCSMYRSESRLKPSVSLDASAVPRILNCAVPEIKDRPFNQRKKGRPRGDIPRGLLQFAAAPDGQPVGGVSSAAPLVTTTHCDHLLPLVPPRSASGTTLRAIGL